MEKKHTAINLRITQSIYDQLKEHLDSLPYHMSMTPFIMQAIIEKLERDGHRKEPKSWLEGI